jgi:hypothetical protein
VIRPAPARAAFGSMKSQACSSISQSTGAVDEHVPVARRLLGLSHRARDVVHVGDQRPLAQVDAGLVAAKDPDRHAVVMVAAPAAAGSKVRRPATTAPVDMNSSTTWPLTPADRRAASRSTSQPVIAICARVRPVAWTSSSFVGSVPWTCRCSDRALLI